MIYHLKQPSPTTTYPHHHFHTTTFLGTAWVEMSILFWPCFLKSRKYILWKYFYQLFNSEHFPNSTTTTTTHTTTRIIIYPTSYLTSPHNIFLTTHKTSTTHLTPTLVFINLQNPSTPQQYFYNSTTSIHHPQHYFK